SVFITQKTEPVPRTGKTSFLTKLAAAVNRFPLPVRSDQYRAFQFFVNKKKRLPEKIISRAPPDGQTGK
ncbi:MAG: hypothetical protein KKG47_16260, partial [Proteobacteria bacterium]|nr:hypothetical protein [Pseudomonadota bacterium]MBU1739631.1 hypothetical protein [Pseudomonadota bacterium]